MSGNDGLKVDRVFKDVVSGGVGGKYVGGVTLPILKVGRPFAVKTEFRTVSKVPGSSQFLTVAISTLITTLETLLFSKVGIDWIGIEIHNKDVNGNGWPGSSCYIDDVVSLLKVLALVG